MDNASVPTTFVALAVVALAILPGAAYLLAFEARSGPYKVSAPDRVIRFLVASAVFHAFAAGVTYTLYRTLILDGQLAQGKVSAWAVEMAALAYVVVPYVIGELVGTAYAKDWPVARWLHRRSRHPRAWDHVFSQHRPGWVRLRLKSGDWIAGAYADLGQDLGAYASAYGEEPDLCLNPTVRIDRETGEFATDDDGTPILERGAILIRWAEVEYAQFLY